MSDELNNEILPEETPEQPETAATPLPPKKSKKKLKKGLLIGGGCVLGLIVLIIILLLVFAGGKLKLINRGSNWIKPSQQDIDDYMAQQTEPVPEDAVVVDPDDIQWGESIGSLEDGDDIINILLIGMDSRPGERYSRSDTMILCTLNKVNKTITLTSFMRDMYVQIPGHYPNRINASYFFGGTKLLNETLAHNFGVEVDANVEINMEGFCACMDQMGGIDIELTQSEANYMINNNLRANPEEPVWQLHAGLNHLTGAQALVYARNRTTGNGDFDRTLRQKKVITAAINKAKTMNIYEINQLIDKFLPYLTTDMSDTEIIDYTWTAVAMFDELQVKQSRIPANGTFYGAWVQGMSVLIPDLDANRKVLEEVMKVN